MSDTASSIVGRYTDSLGEAFSVVRVVAGPTNRYRITSSDGSGITCSERMLREWIGTGYFRRGVAAPVAVARRPVTSSVRATVLDIRG
jgi:hypothetical protein